MSRRTGPGRKDSKKSIPPRKKSGDPYHSRAVEKALELIEILKGSADPVSLHRLFLATKLTKVSLLRILATLERSGYVEKEATAGYRLSAGLRTLQPARTLSRLLQVSEPELKELTRVFRESAALAFLFDNHVEVIAVSESPQTIRMGNTVGRILQPHASSLGKCITEFQSEIRRDNLLRSYGINPLTPNTIVDENRLAAEFARIRDLGYATDDEETAPGGKCFGVPIQMPGGEVRAALSVSVPKHRLAGVEKRLVEAIRAAAAKISRQLANHSRQ